MSHNVIILSFFVYLIFMSQIVLHFYLVFCPPILHRRSLDNLLIDFLNLITQLKRQQSLLGRQILYIFMSKNH